MGDELTGFCSQRQKKQLMFNPIVRLEIDSPYGGLYTEEQLNARRKAEILQYKRDSNKTKQNTQKEDFVLIVNGKQKDPYLQKIYYNLAETTLGKIVLDTYSYLPVNTLICTANTYNGAIDPNVPLYKYNESRNYGILNTIYDYNLYLQTDRNMSIQPNIQTEILNLYTVNAINSQTTVSTLRIPIAWYITGTLKSDQSIPTDGNLKISAPKNVDNITFVDINISQIDYTLKFNNTDISNGSFTLPFSTDISFDINFDGNLTGTNNTFVLQYYIGDLEVNDITIDSTSDYVYDLDLDIKGITNIDLIAQYNSKFNLSYGIIVNPSMDLVETNVTLHTAARPSLNTLTINANSFGESIITSTKYLEDIGTDPNQYAQFQQQVSQPPVPIRKNLSSHIWMDVVNYNNERKIMFRNTTYQNGVYLVEDTSYNPTTTYYLQDGRYFIVNIEQSHPIAIREATSTGAFILTYADNNESINDTSTNIYTPNNYKVTDDKGTSTLDDDIDYYWNSLRLDVSGNFGQASVICKNHSYMGGQNILNYGIGNTPLQEIKSIPVVPEKDDISTGEITAEYRQFQLAQQYNSYQWR